jgi:hypothetical protein
MAAQHLQPGRVTSLGTLPRREPDVLTWPQQPLKGRVDAVDIAVVWNHDQRTPPLRQSGRCRHRHRSRPVAVDVLTWKSQPRGGGGVPGGKASQE